MSENTKETPILIIDENTNIKYEAPEEFQTSVLRNTYAKALKVTQEILERNEAHRNHASGKGQGTVLRNREQIYNIIAFMGDRGTGKTSAMLSYMEFLKDYYKSMKELDAEWKFDSQVLDRDGYMFTGIEYIDASALNNKEDILGSVLSKMLKKWTDEDKHSYGEYGIVKREDYEYKKRQIRMKFSKVYESLKDLRSEKDILDKDSDMYLETLEKLTLTLNVKQSFQDLVKDFLDIMIYPGSEKRITERNHFLVISIDDLDMNVKSGFTMLEQIRLYLMVPNVIVLLSANYEQLEKICYNHYINEFYRSKNDEGMKEHIAKLSREYLEKMIPIQRQIGFDSGQKWDFFSKEKLIIKYVRQNQDKDIIEGMTLEEVINSKYEKYFGVRFGKRGISYLMPDTLREVCSWINQIYSLEPIEEIEKKETAEEKIKAYENNFQWFWNKEFPKVCKKYFDYNKQKVFSTLDVLKVEGQVKQIKGELKTVQNNKINEGLQEILAKAEAGNEREYTFAYFCIIYYTMKFSFLIKKLKWLNDDKDRVKITDEFVKYFAGGKGGIWGTWETRMLYSLVDGDQDTPEFYNIGRTEFSKTNECLSVILEGKISEFLSKEYYNKNVDNLRSFQYLLLFYRLHDFDYMSTQWTLEQGTKDTLTLSKEYSGVFCLSNFVLNVMENGKLIECFLKNLTAILKKAEFNASDISRIKKAISIKDEIEKYKNELLVPICDLEYLVNTGKEIQEIFAENGTKKLEDSEITLLIKRYFSVLRDSLQRYDLVNKTHYKDCFEEFPLIKCIQEMKKPIADRLINAVKAHK